MEDGGTIVLDYEISFDQGIDTWSIIAYGVTEQQYTIVGLTAGTTYKFKVSARNDFGQSDYSSPVSILAA